MKGKKIFSLLIAGMLTTMCLATPAAAIAPSGSDAPTIIRATDRIEATISANTLAVLGDSVSLDSGEVVTFKFTYTPRDASVKFGFIAPDGLFYGLSGSDGSINKGIRVSEPGSYTLAIKNNSGSAVTVSGTVNY